MTRKTFAALVVAAHLLSQAAPAAAQFRAGALAPTGASPVRGVAPAGHAPAAPLSLNPALSGGVLVSGPSLALPNAVAPAVARPAAAVASALPSAALPAPAFARPIAAQANAAKSESKPEGTLGAVSEFAAAVSKPGASGAEVAGRSRQLFDGLRSIANGVSEETPAPASPAEPSRPALAKPAQAEKLAALHPRVVFLLDVFEKPASDQVVDYVHKLVEAGVHVVFLTWRPQKGPGSAEEVLLSRVKAGRTNPVMVVSHNGGRIALHSNAKNPPSIVADLGTFPAGVSDKLQALAPKVAKKLKLSPLATSSSHEGSFSFTAALPEDVPADKVPAQRKRLLKAFNDALAEAGMPYRMQEHPDDPRAVIAQSMPLRFAVDRVLKALDAQYKGEDLLASPEKFLILSDSKRSPKFTASFPKQAEVQVVQNGAAVEAVMGAVLGDKTLDSVSIRLGDLRQYVEYWEPAHRYKVGSSDGESAGGGGRIAASEAERETNKMMAMYVGTVIYNLMAWLHAHVWYGQHITLSELLTKVEQTWRAPTKNGIRIGKTLGIMMRSKSFRAVSNSYLAYAKSYATNYYLRVFGGPETYALAARRIQENHVGLGTDGKSLITLQFRSPSTGRLYKIHTRIPRVETRMTADGLTLVAFAYRTGKETHTDGEEVYAKALAMALLSGYGRKGPDGRWHHGSADGPAIGKLVVQLEYRSSHRTQTFSPEEFLSLEEGKETQGPIVQEITSTIERMRADAEFQAMLEEQREEEKGGEAPTERHGTAGKVKTAKAPKAAAPKGRGKK